MKENSTIKERSQELAQLFFKLGIIGFGGPAAHIAMMEEEVVERRQWLTREHFLDLVGATNLIPGPNSTEMAIHLGYSYGGVMGLAVAGFCFITPAVLITGILAWLYVSFGTLPKFSPLLYGIKPAVLAVIAGALWRLGRKAIKSRSLLSIAGLAIGLLLLGLNEVLALLIGGIVGMLWLQLKSPPDRLAELAIASLNITVAGRTIAASTEVTTPALWQLGLVFLKVGAILFGSGYVLIAFLEGELVGQGWLTQQQLLDAIAIGQFTPGPILSTATFIGYIILGVPGAIAATLGIFLPSFLLVAILNPIVPLLRRSPWSAAFLDAVNASAVALMIVVTVRLAGTIFGQPHFGLPFDPIAFAIAIFSAIALFRFRLNAVWLVLGGAAIGFLSSLIIDTLQLN
ncbi:MULTISPECIES: chromate efflux transporter [Spirulina sp. CCY15215]|uniref:chromate efflux transporter n=1 Tax=Spirulina sp. CCY15215 TaxID=2767591 RepID=UPI00194F8234|nr:chromate efflux transporter [Spirulina major]